MYICTNIHLYMCIYICVYIHICIYIAKEREGEWARVTQNVYTRVYVNACSCMHACVCERTRTLARRSAHGREQELIRVNENRRVLAKERYR